MKKSQAIQTLPINPQRRSRLASVSGYVPPKSPIEAMIDAATGYSEPEPIRPTKEQKEAAQRLANDVMSDLRYYYPDVLKNRPTTWPTHLRNTISAKAAWMLAAHNNVSPTPVR
jgi:hypothetical protein